MIVHDVEPYGKEYWELKRGKPSCSEFKRIITPAKWQFADGAETYAQELIGQEYDFAYGMEEGYVSAAMKNGTAMEPESRRYYEMQRECEVNRVGLVTSDCGNYCYSPDSLVAPSGAVELKNPAPATHIKWLLAGVVPKEHLPQCHGGLLVAELEWIDFMSYCRRLPPLLIRVFRDEKTEKLGEALTEFSKMLTDMRAKIESAGSPVPKVEYAQAF